MSETCAQQPGGKKRTRLQSFSMHFISEPKTSPIKFDKKISKKKYKNHVQ